MSLIGCVSSVLGGTRLPFRDNDIDWEALPRLKRRI